MVQVLTLSVGGLREGVDLEENAVLFDEDLVELLHDVDGLHLTLADEAESGGEARGLLGGEAGLQVDGLLDDRGRVLGRYLLNVAAALGARDDDGALIGALERDGEVELAARKQALAHHHLIARLALAARLLRVQAVAEHVLRHALGLLGAVDELDAAAHAAVKGALATTARQYLRLDDHVVAQLCAPHTSTTN